ncbi:short chain enoyl-CoA hydratase [Thermaerobacter marianensis DSM 12885]|uniref:Probable enoyl-CoA hydratase echA8 n=1 Tax=Thermaerobacter marianensis (strain ATCC 700841 / DSM 12885 / JCM 10246 / 7p75a) TaxID=644966 RepID=E6SMM9_THEM7|nr:enoyl-CoA hydratase-related protein [Thermaerobacter marianensis]ADU51521.1 short chain enoyl-CoA hydratase [Thermaerobacter marianensis DSM 12885]
MTATGDGQGRSYQYLLVEADGPVGIVRLNRPKVLNALCRALIEELADALGAFDRDPAIRCMVLTGNERAFAAGADIAEMAGKGLAEVTGDDLLGAWQRLWRIRKPVVAAVQGYCLGGGFELAMGCDLIVAGESAQFGQPEIKIGVIPGAGGTQRLTRVAGKYKAMEAVLTGRMIPAREAEAWGLVTKVVPDEQCLPEALRLARTIAGMPPLAVQMAKAAVLQAYETPLGAGLEFERRLFYSLFATEDQKEGMQAFLEKRSPQWKGR